MRAFRLMHVYEHLRQAGDWMAEEIAAQQYIVGRLGISPRAVAVIADARKMMESIAAQQSHVADIVSAICGETAFKTGEVHQRFYQLLAEQKQAQ